jgi:hypothetical protein
MAAASRAALLAGSLVVLGACVADPPAPDRTGTPVATGALALDFRNYADGALPFLGASNVRVEAGALQLSPGRTSGQVLLPVETLGGSSTVRVRGRIPLGSSLLIARARVRDAGNQSGFGVIVAPLEPPVGTDPPRASAFLVALGVGNFIDPRTGALASLGCGGSTGRTFVRRFTSAGATSTPAFVLEGALLDLFRAPQLSVVAEETKSGGVSTELLSGEDSEVTFTLVRTGEGAGTLSARQGSTELFGAPVGVDKAKTAGTSMACKLSYAACAETCARGVGSALLGADCTVEDCGTASVVSGSAPKAQPVDFQEGETCRQTAALPDSCNLPLSPESATAVAYRAACMEVFGRAGGSDASGGSPATGSPATGSPTGASAEGGAPSSSNQFLLILSRSFTGESPTVRSVEVTR